MTAMIDWIQVRDLNQEVGPEDFEELVALFLEEADEVTARLASTQEADARLGEDLHFLKGSALNIGFRDFADACAEGEAQAATGQSAQIDLPRILSLYASSRETFLREVPERLGA